MSSASKAYAGVTPLLRLNQQPPLTVLSAGLGQDSAMLAALCLEDNVFQCKYIPGDLLIMSSETGMEHVETNEHRLRFAELCHSRQVDYIHITPEMGFHPRTWPSIHGQRQRNTAIQDLLRSGELIGEKLLLRRAKTSDFLLYSK